MGWSDPPIFGFFGFRHNLDLHLFLRLGAGHDAPNLLERVSHVIENISRLGVQPHMTRVVKPPKVPTRSIGMEDVMLML